MQLYEVILIISVTLGLLFFFHRFLFVPNYAKIPSQDLFDLDGDENIDPSSSLFNSENEPNTSLTIRECHKVNLSRAGRGLINDSNVCFLISVLQCLRHTPTFLNEFSECFNEKMSSRAKNGVVIDKNEKKVLDMLYHLLILMRDLSKDDCKNGPINPKMAQECFSVCTDLVTSPSISSEVQYQQDAEEFLSFLLNTIHDTLLQKMELFDIDKEYEAERTRLQCLDQMRKCNSENAESYSTAVKLLGMVEWDDYYKENKSIISKMFSGQVVRGSLCKSCNQLSCTYEEFRVLQLDIAFTQQCNVSLELCLKHFTTRENLYGDNKRICPGKCGEYSEGSQTQVLFHHVPQYLIVQLKRFKHDGVGCGTKIKKQVSFPVKQLDITNYQFVRDTNNPCLYGLYAVCAHTGSSLDSGHYIAFIKPHLSASWYLFNDDEVTESSEQNLIRQTINSAYILFYRRLEEK